MEDRRLSTEEEMEGAIDPGLRPAGFPEFVIGLGGVRRPIDPITGLAYQDQVGGAPMLGWRGGQLRIHNGIVYEGDQPAFGLRGNQILRALPPEFGPSLQRPGGEDLSKYVPEALVGYTPPVAESSPVTKFTGEGFTQEALH